MTETHSPKARFVYPVLIVVFLASLFLRYYGFSQPHRFTFDEGLYAELIAEQLKKDPLDYSTQEAYRFQTAQGQSLPKYLDRPLFKHPPMYCLLIAQSYRMFGSSHLTAVSVSIILGCLMILLVFFLGKKLYDERVGLLAAFILCIDPVHWVCSERIWMETTLSFFMLLAIFLFVLGRENPKYLLWSGVAVGLGMLTKYPAALSLIIVLSFAALKDRSMFKQKGFWLLCLLSFLVFSPWVIWNWKTFGGVNDAVVVPHAVEILWRNTTGTLVKHKGVLLVLSFLGVLIFVLRHKITGFWTERRTATRWALCTIAFILALIGIPFVRAMAIEAFAWQDAVHTDWHNAFKAGPWHFYLTRLAELSPLYLFSFISLFFIFGKNQGDWLLAWASVCILGAFILIGNYQSRYILPAVPFLVILSSRMMVLIYDKLSTHPGAAISSDASAYKTIGKIAYIGVVLYFILKTLMTDRLIAIGPDFGYF